MNQRSKRGTFHIRYGRYFIRIQGKLILRSHIVWNKYHPNDTIKKGEHIHHINGDPLDDRHENLQKLSNSDHTILHGILNKWRADHPNQARENGKNAIRLIKQRMELDPEFKAWVVAQQKKSIPKAAKSRTGKKRTEEVKAKHSSIMKSVWADPIKRKKILEKRQETLVKRMREQPNYTKKLSEEHKRKIGENTKKCWGNSIYRETQISRVKKDWVNRKTVGGAK